MTLILAIGLEFLDLARNVELAETQVKGVPTFVEYP
jgi:hypothetical protein